ncbi:MAG: hypothetical protein HZA93_16695 [Verrucomicrobia bacterium]|nr:hypothetical protein [Verrucomicrobiota bacterium]
MKLPVLLLAASLAGNALLVALFFSRPALAPPALREFFTTDADRAAHAADESRAIRTRVAERERLAADQQSRIWAALQTDDLPTLIARLRAAGFSPTVIRSVVNAQLDRWFRTRMKELVGEPADTPFWKPDAPGPFSNAKLFEAQSQLYRERAKKLRELLGAEAFAGADPTAAQRREFGQLPKAKIDLIQRINDDYAEMSQQISAAAQGMMLPEDREKLALLERERRADLAAVLTTEELEDYLMRSSPITSRLRQALSFMDATEAEFRTLYQIHRPFADALYPSATGSGVVYYTSEMSQKRRDAQNKIAEQAKGALGEPRFEEFVRASSYEFQQLTRLAQRESLPADAAVRAFNARDFAAKESMRIFEDRALSNDQKRTALQTLAQTTTTTLVSALGANAGTAYAKSASWLSTIANGGAVSFSLDGSSTSYRSLPPAGAVPPRP